MNKNPQRSFRDRPERLELLQLYREVDELLAHLCCDASAECCHFARTGREPYPTAIELAELRHALDARPLASPERRDKKRLALAEEERRCPILGEDGRCRTYAARPFGCRTYFCDRVQGGHVPRAELKRIGRAIADLSARFDPRDPAPRPLLKAIAPRFGRVM